VFSSETFLQGIEEFGDGFIIIGGISIAKQSDDKSIDKGSKILWDVNDLFSFIKNGG
jgi:hypothetical protein